MAKKIHSKVAPIAAPGQIVVDVSPGVTTTAPTERAPRRRAPKKAAAAKTKRR